MEFFGPFTLVNGTIWPYSAGRAAASIACGY